MGLTLVHLGFPSFEFGRHIAWAILMRDLGLRRPWHTEMGWLGRGLPAWCADDLLEKLVLNAIGSLCRGRRVTGGDFMDAVLLLSLHAWVGGHAMELVIGGKRHRLQMGPELTALAGWLQIDGRGRTLSAQDARGRLARGEAGGAIDVVDQIEKAQGLLWLLDIPMMVGWGTQVRYHGGGDGLMITVYPPITSANLISWAASVGRLRGTVGPLLQLHHTQDRIHQETKAKRTDFRPPTDAKYFSYELLGRADGNNMYIYTLRSQENPSFPFPVPSLPVPVAHPRCQEPTRPMYSGSVPVLVLRLHTSHKWTGGKFCNSVSCLVGKI